MSVAGLILVKDEADIVEWSVRWLARQVDAVYVLENGSTDGTRQILERLVSELGHDRLAYYDDPEVGYYQSRKMSALAGLAYERGHEWVVPCDADEFWRLGDAGARLGDYLDDLPLEARFVAADLYDHKATGLDPAGDPDPSRRMGWRFLEPGKLPKVAARTSPSLEIAMGNHGAKARTVTPVSSTGFPPTLTGTVFVEHYGWRSAEQFESKIRNGYYAYRATTGLEDYGDHWKAFGPPDDPQFRQKTHGWFREWAYAHDPRTDPDIGYFPWRVD